MCSKQIGLHAQYTISILGLIANIVEGNYMAVDKRENLHFENEWDIHRSSKNYEESGYSLQLD